MSEITPDDIDTTLSGGQQLLKLLIGAAIGFAATKLSDKAFDRAILMQRLKELTNA